MPEIISECCELVKLCHMHRSGPFFLDTLQYHTNDCLLIMLDWGTLVVAKMSPWLQPDSRVETVRRNSEEVSASLKLS